MEDEFNNVSKLIDKCLKPNVKNITPCKIYDRIHLKTTINKIVIELKDNKGIYGFLCKIDNKLYIGSSENLVKRFKEHVKGQKSNIRLQRAIKKYGLNNFYYLLFELYNSKDKILLTNFETIYIYYFNFESLYNFKNIGQSMLGKLHTIMTKEKISLATRNSKNPIFGRKHRDISKNLISKALSKPVYMYKIIDNQLELKEIFPSSVKLN
jgi:group I intron endonuclease